MSRRRKQFSEKERAEIFAADKIPGLNAARCRYCGGIIKAGEPWDVCHEEPASSWLWAFLPRGWRDARWQVGVSHPHCNRSAGAEPMTFWQSLSLRTKIRMVGGGVIVLAIILIAIYWSMR